MIVIIITYSLLSLFSSFYCLVSSVVRVLLLYHCHPRIVSSIDIFSIVIICIIFYSSCAPSSGSFHSAPNPHFFFYYPFSLSQFFRSIQDYCNTPHQRPDHSLFQVLIKFLVFSKEFSFFVDCFPDHGYSSFYFHMALFIICDHNS